MTIYKIKISVKITKNTYNITNNNKKNNNQKIKNNNRLS